MSITAQDDDIWISCASGDGNALNIVAGRDGAILIAAHEEIVEPDTLPDAELSIPPQEALALGHLLIEMATRQISARREMRAAPMERH